MATPGVTYNLLSEPGPNYFYRHLSLFTNDVWAVACFHLGSHIHEYRSFVEHNYVEPTRSKDEYLLELVITGILVKNYYAKSNQTSPLFTKLLSRLYSLRKHHQKAKPIIDKVRGILGYVLLEKKKNTTFNWTARGFCRMLKWLSATGEFNEEVIRLNNWVAFYERTS